MANATIIIPARYGSTRFPGKPLALLHGKPLIEHVWRAATKTGLPVHVATDNTRIYDTVTTLGGNAVMTEACNNGTERCADAAQLLDIKGTIINWQGDSPLVPAQWIYDLVLCLEDSAADVATPVQQCTPRQSRDLRMDFIAGQPSGTCAVCDLAFQALYFSKAPVPTRGPWFMHVGVYAYRREALDRYGTEESLLERSEKLEQLRFVEMGLRIQCLLCTGEPIWEVNNPADIAKVEFLMARGHHGIAGKKDRRG